MKPSRIGTAGVLTAAALLLVATRSAAASTSPWTITPSPNQGSRYNALYDVSAVNPANVWAVGDGSGAPLVERWNGESWTIKQTAAAAGDYLASIVTPGASNITIAGGTNANLPSVTTEHWDGTAWTRSVIPIPAGEDSLSDVYASSPTDVWAGVARDNQAAAQTTLSLAHWNGVRWKMIPLASDNDYFCSLSVLDILPLSDTNVWAIYDDGCSEPDNTDLHQVVRWNGSKLKVEAAPHPAGAVLVSYDGLGASASNDVWVGGFYQLTDSGHEYPLAGHWNGSRWVGTEPPSSSSSEWLGGVAAVSPDNVWVVGARTGPTGERYNLFDHWNGSSWAVSGRPSPSTGSGVADVTAVPGTTNTWWAVGLSGSEDRPRTMTLRCCS